MIGKIAMFFKNILDWIKSDFCIFNYFSDALKITNSNIILATPLILFTIFASSYLYIAPANNINMSIVLILFFAMTAAFFSGWFYTIKLAINSFDTTEFVKPVANTPEEKESERQTENIKGDVFYLLKQFPTGVGKYFLEYFFLVGLFFLLLTFVILFTYKAAYALIGNIGISRPDLFFALSTPETMVELLKSLTPEQQQKLSQWNLFFLLTTTLYSFIVMFWAPEIVFKNMSVLNAFITSVVNLFKKFFKSLTIFAYLMFIYFIISILSVLISSKIVGFLLTVLYFYFLVYAAVLVFLFYKKEFIIDDK